MLNFFRTLDPRNWFRGWHVGLLTLGMLVGAGFINLWVLLGVWLAIALIAIIMNYYYADDIRGDGRGEQIVTVMQYLVTPPIGAWFVASALLGEPDQ